MTPSKLLLPDGTGVAYQLRALTGSMGKEVLALWQANGHTTEAENENTGSWGSDF